jgi:hypothetical protein
MRYGAILSNENGRRLATGYKCWAIYISSHTDSGVLANIRAWVYFDIALFVEGKLVVFTQ